MAKCVFCGREEAEINGVEMRRDYLSRHKNYLYKGISVPFIFHHDQNDGRDCEGPYISPYEVNACQECLIKGSGFYGYGALGCNNYSIASNFALDEEIYQRAQKIAEELFRERGDKISQLKSDLSFALRHPFRFFLQHL